MECSQCRRVQICDDTMNIHIDFCVQPHVYNTLTIHAISHKYTHAHMRLHSIKGNIRIKLSKFWLCLRLCDCETERYHERSCLYADVRAIDMLFNLI